MIEELLRELRHLEGRHEVSAPLPSDADGYFDRECPPSACHFQFKVHEEDWRDKVREEEVFCAFCGHTAESGEWFTEDQIEHGLALIGKLGAGMAADASAP